MLPTIAIVGVVVVVAVGAIVAVGAVIAVVAVVAVVVHGPGPLKEPFSTKTRDKFQHSFLITLIPLDYFGV